MKKKKAPRKCCVCGKSTPRCDRAVYLAHGNGGAYGTDPAHKKCVKQAIAEGLPVDQWNEDPGWYVRGADPKLKDL